MTAQQILRSRVADEDGGGSTQVAAQTCRERLPGLDLVKCIALVAVTMIHSTYFSFTVTGDYSQATPWLVVFDVYALFVSSAVPSLLAVSLYLYVRRRSEDPSYLRARLRRLATILAVWWPTYAVVGPLVGYAGFTHDLVGVLTMPVTDGGLYFLGTLIALVLMAEGLLRVGSPADGRVQVAAGVTVVACFAVVLAAFVYLPESPVHMRKLIDLGPLMFLPIAPAVVLFATSASKARALTYIALVALVFEAAYWWASGTLADVLRGVPGNYFGLTYIHPVMTAVALGVLALGLRWKYRLPKVVGVCARYALGYYLIHILVYPTVMQFLARPTIPVRSGMVFFNPLAFVAIASLTAAIVAVLSRTWLRRAIS